MPKLLETFDQLKMSSEIRSSDRFPNILILFMISEHLIVGLLRVSILVNSG